jgi:thiol-disulfide isomerase/thioredoxin
MVLAAGLGLTALALHLQAAPAPQPAEKSESTSGSDSSLPPGIDISKLDDFERKVFFRIVSHESSVCGKGHSLLYSAKNDAACKASFYAVRYVVRLVDSGFTDSEVSERLDKRFRTPRVPRFDLASSPYKGPASARVTIVEFVDYECPHCKHAQALLHQALAEYPNDIKVYFKHFPLSMHTGARLAAQGAVAAQKQGKFWPFNDKVWAQMDDLTPATLEKIAKAVGLDVARWRKDAKSDEVINRVKADRSEGDDLHITGTPAIYINGRKYIDPLEIVSLKDWIDEELGR